MTKENRACPSPCRSRRVFQRLCAAIVLASLPISIAAFHATASAEAVKLISTEIPGYVSKTGGAYRDFFSAAAEDAGVELDITLVPWVRAVSRAERSDDLMIFPFSRTAEREPRFHWAAELDSVETGFAAIGREVDSLEAAKSLSTIIVWRGSSQEAFLKSEGFTNLFSVSDAKTIFSLLAQGRATAWFGVLAEANATISQDANAADIRLGRPIYADTVWLAGGRKLQTEKYRAFLNAIARLRDEGLLKELIAKYKKAN